MFESNRKHGHSPKQAHQSRKHRQKLAISKFYQWKSAQVKGIYAISDPIAASRAAHRAKLTNFQLGDQQRIAESLRFSGSLEVYTLRLIIKTISVVLTNASVSVAFKVPAIA